MQPESSTLEQLAQLPLPAMEALLNSNQLKVLSENTTLAAVTYWLKQDGRREALTAEQLHRLASKLRLCRCTRWYLTARLMDTEGWLYEALSHEQRTMLLATISEARDWALFAADDPDGCLKLLGGGSGGAVPEVDWWKDARNKSKDAPLALEISPAEVWNAEGRVLVVMTVFYNGMRFELSPAFDKVQEASSGKSSQEVYEFIFSFRHCQQQPPIAYSAALTLQAPDVCDALRGYMEVHDFKPTRKWSIVNIYGSRFSSLQEAEAALCKQIHSDGKLHVTVRITVK